MSGRTLSSSPNLIGLYAKAALGSIPLPGRDRSSDASTDLYDLQLRVDETVPDKGRVARYRKVCGFPAGEVLPETFPQVLAFPLHLALMTDARFPFPAVGAVHIANTIRQHRPILIGEKLALDVSVNDLRPHSRGRQVTLMTTCTIDNIVVWQGETVVLHRERTSATIPSGNPLAVPDQAPTGPLVWKLPSNLGRQYAAVSGDRNPIHLYDVTALPMGFKHHIAHGMWSKARCLAELSNRVPEAFSIAVAFKKPINLPGKVRFGARTDAGRIDFGLTSASNPSPHVLGRISPL